MIYAEMRWSSLYSKTFIFFSRRLSLERIVSSHIKKPDYFYRFHYPGSTIGVPSIKNESEINTTRLSCKMAGQVLEACSRLIKACDHDMNIRFVDARYAGSTHDSFVWNNSSLKACLEAAHQNGDQNSIYLGDSGYPLSPYLLTPFRHAESGTRESIFNKKHAKARNVVERTIGVLKCRFRCLLSDRKMRYDPAKVTSVINICCALHNICKKFRIGDPEEAETFFDAVVPLEPINENGNGSPGERRRRQIADALM
ncbi:uncharacterized protein LOC105223759 isoform X5 [Bactrocera dorsalis]|uniref:Uncharacterized protein LOC105223759 isoform X5 n=1 Tax=Bactrocera dorsalis TaxID=27457 RepID=A0ABM3IYH6_BACDO|nr:uncharacterized protein LOC105223759 isoform X5 [Bactrocera dorsalis]